MGNETIIACNIVSFKIMISLSSIWHTTFLTMGIIAATDMPLAACTLAQQHKTAKPICSVGV